MERTEPSLAPEWLKGASGSALVSPHLAFHQVSSERGSSSFGRRSYSSSFVDRSNVDRQNISSGRLDSSSSRSSSCKQGFRLQAREEQESNKFAISGERDWVNDGERFVQPMDTEGFTAGNFSDERKKERNHLENGRVRLIIPGKLGNYEADAKLRGPQSLGLSPDNNSWKQTETISPSMTSDSSQMSAFERDFPSLGTDDKQFGSSPMGSLHTHSLWQSSPCSDVGKAFLIGNAGSMGSPSNTSSINGGSGASDTWNSALVGTHLSNENIQNISLGKSAMSCGSLPLANAANSVSTPAINAGALKMAEALSQPLPRIRTPPQSSAESQRLEELAIKQSRQLIPVMPSLLKTMSLNDKGKSKTIRTVDASRPSSSSKLDMLKHSQGKLLILKPNKDGGVLSTTSLKPEGSIGTQSSPYRSSSTLSLPLLGISGSTQHTRPHGPRFAQPDNGSVDGLRGVHTKDLMEDKRSSIQAQNRNDFFNTLRKKAASTNDNSHVRKSDSQLHKGEGKPSEAAMLGEAGISDNVSHKELDPGSIGCDFHFHSNSVIDEQKRAVLEMGWLDCDSSAVGCPEEVTSVDSEEEEAAFMRSLGWEEHAEDTGLTDEEINAFHQMREKRKSLGHEVGAGDARVDPSI